MTRTDFRPSIHGWPFGNSFDYSIVWGIYTFHNVGFCGGMCWRALHYFYRGQPTLRGIRSAPALVEIPYMMNSKQPKSFPASTIAKIINWQAKPDIGHWWNPLNSLGNETQKEWDGIKQNLDQYKPITLTLITSSNDANPAHFEDNHRVIAYAYENVSVSNDNAASNYDPEAPNNATLRVTISIYDPNFEMDDDVKLTFYLHGENSNIHIRHNRNKEVHGFFLDDKDRSFAYEDNTLMQIKKCDLIGFNGLLADYNLEFSWKCRIISYFTIQIDGIDWNLNHLLRDQYTPTIIIDSNNSRIDAIHKQVPSRIGSLTLSIKLPRKLTTIAVKLLDSNDIQCFQSIQINLLPTIEYQLKIQKNAIDPDPLINDNDLFIKNPSPTNSEIQQVDTSPFRWIKIMRNSVPTPGSNPAIRDPVISIIKKYKLGNIKVPYLSSFKETNLVPPTQISGDIKITKNRCYKPN